MNIKPVTPIVTKISPVKLAHPQGLCLYLLIRIIPPMNIIEKILNNTAINIPKLFIMFLNNSYFENCFSNTIEALFVDDYYSSSKHSEGRFSIEYS